MTRRRTTRSTPTRGKPARGPAGEVTVPAHHVESLCDYLTRAADTTTTAQDRADVRVELCGYLSVVLDCPPPDGGTSTKRRSGGSR